jgi:hypothetical protein
MSSYSMLKMLHVFNLCVWVRPSAKVFPMKSGSNEAALTQRRIVELADVGGLPSELTVTQRPVCNTWVEES